jgi:citrate lyase subunit beta / citryl-CoA lyase
VTETARSLADLASYASVPGRTRGLTWGGEDLSSDLGALENRDSSGRYLPLYEFARSFCLLAAASARVAAIDAVYTDFRDGDGLALEARAAAAAGFSGKLAIHPDQIAIINDAFTPSVSQFEWARQVVAAFQSGPGTGVASLNGRMLDRPHLLQARRLLSRAGDSSQGSGAQ